MNALDSEGKGDAKSGAEERGEKKPKLGSGARFAALKSKLAKEKGVKNPGALAAYIGQKKYGASKMSQMAAKNR